MLPPLSSHCRPQAGAAIPTPVPIGTASSQIPTLPYLAPSSGLNKYTGASPTLKPQHSLPRPLSLPPCSACPLPFLHVFFLKLFIYLRGWEGVAGGGESQTPIC